jgi:CO/xanthine dehydrogenase Mo-binding subunit
MNVSYPPAQDAATAAEAVRSILVQYDPLPAVVDVLEALRPEAPLVHEAVASYHGVNPQHIAGNICYRSSVA